MKEVSFRNDVLPLKNALFRLALRITLNREEAEDIVQDTLIKVWKHRERWAEIDNMEAFAMTICRNLSLDHLRCHNNNNESLDGIKTEGIYTDSNPLEQTQQRDKIDTVKRIIDGLPEKQRTCMQLRDFEENSYKEIAAILQITEEQVKINIFRARKAVKESFLKIENYGL